MKSSIRYTILLVSLALYIYSLFQPAFTCKNDRTGWLGYEVLFFGWLGLLSLDPRWFANIGLLLAWFKFLSPTAKVPLLELVSPFILLSAITALVLFNPIGCPGVDTPTAVSGLALGGYLWVAANLVTFCGLFALSKDD